MASLSARRRWRTAGYVAPLCVVIGAALYWSSFATFQHAVGPDVPGEVAWALPVTLDGAVVVTTPVMLSTVLSVRIRGFAGFICASALIGSMAINSAETGLIGAAPPLVAGLLIHLVGLVLRDFRRIDAEADAPQQTEVVATPLGSEHLMPLTIAETAGPDFDSVQPPASPEPDRSVGSPATAVPAPSEDSVPALSLLPPERGPQEIVFAMLDRALSDGLDLPSGPKLTAAVRAAGHVVSDEYGRTTKARWRKSREEGRAA